VATTDRDCQGYEHRFAYRRDGQCRTNIRTRACVAPDGKTAGQGPSFLGQNPSHDPGSGSLSPAVSGGERCHGE
jgi:hypothetical protein